MEHFRHLQVNSVISYKMYRHFIIPPAPNYFISINIQKLFSSTFFLSSSLSRPFTATCEHTQFQFNSTLDFEREKVSFYIFFRLNQILCFRSSSFLLWPCRRGCRQMSIFIIPDARASALPQQLSLVLLFFVRLLLLHEGKSEFATFCLLNLR